MREIVRRIEQRMIEIVNVMDMNTVNEEVEQEYYGKS